MTANAALPAGGKYLTAQELLDIVGESVTGRYYNGNSYVDVTYRYSNVQTIAQLQQATASDIVAVGKQYLVYSASVSGVNTNPDYITFDIRPEFSVLNTNYIYTFIGHSITSGLSPSVYNPPRWEWYINGRQTVFQNTATSPDGNAWAHARAQYQFWWTYAECNYQSNEPVSGYSLRASFYGNSTGNNALLVIGLPYISDSGSGSSGTLAPDSGSSPTYTVVVNVDNAGVESGLNNVVSAVDGLQNAIQDDGNYDYGDVDEVIEDAPSGVDEDAIEDAMSKADVILDRIPSVIATGAFWMNTAKDLVNDEAFIIIVPACMLLSFIVYLWWKK